MKSKKQIISSELLQSLAIVVGIFGGSAGVLASIGVHPYILFCYFYCAYFIRNNFARS